MRTLKNYIPIALQAALLLTGYFLISAGLASNDNTERTSILYSDFTTDMETEPTVEIWMTDLNSWSETSSDGSITNENNSNVESLLLEDNVREEELALEEWMLSASANNWELNMNTVLDTEKEEELTMEEWMTDLSQWND